MKQNENKLIELWMKAMKPVDLLWLDIDGLPTNIESVEWEEYWVEKNIVGEDAIKGYIYTNQVVQNAFYDWTEKDMEDETDKIFEKLQDDGDIVRRLVVKMEVPSE